MWTLVRAGLRFPKVPVAMSAMKSSILPHYRPYSDGPPPLTKAFVEQRILDVLSNCDKIDPTKLSATANFEKDLGLDSLDVVDALFYIEEEFTIEMPNHEADEIRSVDQAVDYILKQADVSQLVSSGNMRGRQVYSLVGALLLVLVVLHYISANETSYVRRIIPYNKQVPFQNSFGEKDTAPSGSLDTPSEAANEAKPQEPQEQDGRMPQQVPPQKNNDENPQTERGGQEDAKTTVSPAPNLDSPNSKSVVGGSQSVVPRRENATFVTLCREGDAAGIMKAIRSYEDRFNHKHHYDWIFLNTEEFSAEFKELISRLVSGTAKFGLIPTEHWSYPDFIDQERAKQSRDKLEEENVIYGGSESYRHMCRFESGFFYRHPLMLEYKYYWRVEPDTYIFCDMDFDPFTVLREENKVYGFTITLYEFMKTIPTLWNQVTGFMEKHPNYIHKDNLMGYLSDDGGRTYNGCHFWSNFEIADADFWRGDAYSEFFDHLDKSGGFFYERWGDAPVHSIAASLFLNKSQIHLFENIGYHHPPYFHVPNDVLGKNLVCSILESRSFDWEGYSCMRQFYRGKGWDLPKGVD